MPFLGLPMLASCRLIVLCPPRLHFRVEDLLALLREAAARPAAAPPHAAACIQNPRAVAAGTESGAGLLGHLRLLRRISSEDLRSAGPAFGDGVTGEELEACNRSAFGLLDVRR